MRVVILLLFVLGLIVVALPDSDERLFSLSKGHGPSIQDGIGLIMVFIAYIWFLKQVWSNKEKVLKYKASPIFHFGLFFSGVGYGLIIASVINDYKYWWIVGAILLISLHIIVAYIGLKKITK